LSAAETGELIWQPKMTPIEGGGWELGTAIKCERVKWFVHTLSFSHSLSPLIVLISLLVPSG